MKQVVNGVGPTSPGSEKNDTRLECIFWCHIIDSSVIVA